MKKAKCPLFIFLVIFAYFDSQRICINQNQNQSVGVTKKKADDNIKTFVSLHA